MIGHALDQARGQAIEHGGALDRAIAEFGGRREDWLDLSTGINPRPYPLPEISSDAWHRLPDRDAEARLIAAARRFYAVPDALEIVPAPGTQALIQALPRLLPGDTATILRGEAGTYGEHEHCCAGAGRKVRFAASPEDVAGDEALVVLVHPNNPDGQCRDREALAGLADTLRGGVLVVDEAFCDATPEASVIPAMRDNVIVLRSFGKFFGLAGVRLGFAVCAPELAERIRAWFGPWAVSGPALEIGMAALCDAPWIEATRNRMESDSTTLAKLLEENRFSVVGRNALFVTVRHDNAMDVAQALARLNILVRSFADRPSLLRFGLCGFEAERLRLANALEACVPA